MTLAERDESSARSVPIAAQPAPSERDELAEYLNALERHDCYRVDAVLKDSPVERTERVFYTGNNGSELGPFIRKTIANSSGKGRVYEMVYHAQQIGKRFAHMPRIFECTTTPTSLTVLIEYVQGCTLQEYVEANGASRELSLRIFPLLCDAVRELHEAFDPPVIHRDLTPANIIVSNGSVTLIDLGIARIFRPDAQRDTAYFGTRAYAPPEQFGFGQTDVRSDIYAMGKVLQYCLTGSPDQTVYPDLPMHDPANPDISATTAVASAPDSIQQQVREVITQATSFDPDMRYRSISELKQAFLAAIVLPEPDEADRLVDGSDLASISIPCKPQPAIVHAPVSHELQSVTSSNSATHTKGFVHRIPKGLGIVWDIALALLLFLFYAAGASVVVAPDESLAMLPLWFRALEVYGMILVPLTVICYYLLDLRVLREKRPNWKLVSRRKTWYFVPVVVIVLWVVIGVIGVASGAI